MSVAVIIPYAPLCEHRTRAGNWCLSRWFRLLPSASVVTMSDTGKVEGRTPGTFNKPMAVNHAVREFERGVPPDVYVIADCDTTTDASIGVRIKAAMEGKWSCSSMYRRLTEEQTEEALATEPNDLALLPRTDDQEMSDKSWSGVVVLPRAALLAIGGLFDERFDGWSADDIALAAALETLYRPVTRIGTVWHLHHPRPLEDSYGREGYEHARDLTERYEAAKGDIPAMMALTRGVS